MNKRVVGVYDNGHDAIKAVEDLQADGYARDDISVIAKDPEDAREVTDETGTKAGEGAAAGAATGGVLGGLTGFLAGVGALAIPGVGPILAAGPIAATIAGAATGAGAGGITGALIGMGIPDDEAERYESDIKAGKILVLVDADHSVRDRTSSLDADNGLRTGADDVGLRDRTNRLDDREALNRERRLEETRDPLITGDPMVDATRGHEGTLNPYDTKNGVVTDTSAGQEGKPFRKDNDSRDPIV